MATDPRNEMVRQYSEGHNLLTQVVDLVASLEGKQVTREYIAHVTTLTNEVKNRIANITNAARDAWQVAEREAEKLHEARERWEDEHGER